MTTIHIPPAALEAGARLLCRNAYKHLPEMSNQDTYTPDAEYWLDQARAAFEAMVEAWEGAAVCHYTIADDEGYEMVLPLPFPQETHDDE